MRPPHPASGLSRSHGHAGSPTIYAGPVIAGAIEMLEERMERRLSAILAADIAGYSALMGADEARTVRDLKGHQAVVLPMVGEFAGRIIDTAGDGILAEFPSVVNAVKCAVAIQTTMAERNAAVEPERRMQFRVGINIGDVVYDEVRIYGDGINVAARLESIAEAGGICISSKVFDEINGRLDLACQDIGEQQLKNIARPVRAYHVRLNGDAAPVACDRRRCPDKPSIAVLPFANMSGDAEQEFFADGMTEDLITDLSKVSGLFVIARNSSFAYKGRSVKVQEIGRDLGVRFVLEGSIRKAGNRVRITAQLIDAGNGGHLWAERFDRDLTDIFAMQDEVVEKIVGALAVTLTQGEEQRLRRRGTEQRGGLRSPGCAHANCSPRHAASRSRRPRGCTAGRSSSMRIFRRRMRDWRSPPDLRLRQRLGGRSGAGAGRGGEMGAPRARIERAGAGEPHGARQRLLWRRDHDGALAECRRMIALDPNFAQGYGATGLVLMYAGQPAEALKQIAIAMRLDPHYVRDRAALPRAGEFLPGAIRDRRPAACRAHRPHARHRREPHAAGVLLRPSRAPGRRAGGMGGAAQGESGLLADAARACAAVQGSR